MLKLLVLCYVSARGDSSIVQSSTLREQNKSGLSHPFLGMGPEPMELGKLAAF